MHNFSLYRFQEQDNQDSGDESPPKKQRVSETGESPEHVDQEPDEVKSEQSETPSVVAIESEPGSRASAGSDNFTSVSQIVTMDIPDEDMPITRGVSFVLGLVVGSFSFTILYFTGTGETTEDNARANG